MTRRANVGLLLVVLAIPFIMAPVNPACPDCHFFAEGANLAAGAQHAYVVQVTAGHRYDIVLRAKGGDPNLYVRAGQPPTLTRFDCRPNLAGSLEEVCELNATVGGNEYLMVVAKKAATGYELAVYESGLGCHPGAPGGKTFCAGACLCGYGDGHCDADAECAGGLTCELGAGPNYGWPSSVNVCE
jgi:hypothetical protein